MTYDIVQIVMMGQDDPKKCTAAKLVKFKMAMQVRRIPANSILLHPYADEILLPRDGNRNICAIDCSWRLAPQEFTRMVHSNGRHLPPLLAGNPTNYAKIGKLSTVEAISAALYITGFIDRAISLLDKFRWGHTFLELNAGPLQEYSSAHTTDQMYDIAKSYRLLL